MVHRWAARLLGRLRALELPAEDYAVFGSGPLAVRGLIEHIGDLDVVARGPAWRNYTLQREQAPQR